MKKAIINNITKFSTLQDIISDITPADLLFVKLITITQIGNETPTHKIKICPAAIVKEHHNIQWRICDDPLMESFEYIDRPDNMPDDILGCYVIKDVDDYDNSVIKIWTVIIGCNLIRLDEPNYFEFMAYDRDAGNYDTLAETSNFDNIKTLVCSLKHCNEQNPSIKLTALDGDSYDDYVYSTAANDELTHIDI